jgi:hypothetical protein
VRFTENLVPKDRNQINKALKVTLVSKTDTPDALKKFTWSTKAFTEDRLELQIYFENPLAISAEGTQNLDELEISVKNPFLFKSFESSEMIPRGTIIWAGVPPQVPSGSEAALDNAAMAAEVATKTTFLTTTAVLVSNGALSEVWGMINAIQLLSFIFYMDLYMPANAKLFFDFLIKIGEFEFVDLKPAYKVTFGWMYNLDQNFQFNTGEVV